MQQLLGAGAVVVPTKPPKKRRRPFQLYEHSRTAGANLEGFRSSVSYG
jgi:hypothetical protein